jgi:hypothetical protein
MAMCYSNHSDAIKRPTRSIFVTVTQLTTNTSTKLALLTTTVTSIILSRGLKRR